MRIFSGQPDDFLNWAATELEDNEAHNPQGAFYRRSDFARYLSYLSKRIEGFDALNFMDMQVASLAQHKQCWQLNLTNGDSLMADQLVLATGNPPPRWPCEKALNVFPKTDSFYWTSSSSLRTIDSVALAEIALTSGYHGAAYSNVQEALNTAIKHAKADDLIFVGGSTFVVADLNI